MSDDVTRILGRIEAGEPRAADELLPLVYDELRKLAAARMAQEQPGQTLQATALVHEAYVRLVDANQVPSWESRGHFFAAAAEAMRRILVERARHKDTQRSGGLHRRVELDDVQPAVASRSVDLIALDEALARLAREHPRQAELVKLRFFAGLSVREAAAVLGIAPSTAVTDWAYAKSWLGLALSDGHASQDSP